MAKLIDLVMKTGCVKCKQTVKRSDTKPVSVGQRVYTLCGECAWQLEGWLHQPPMKPVTTLPIEVVETNVKEETKKEGAE